MQVVEGYRVDYARDGLCQDGMERSVSAMCRAGFDCHDCGLRFFVTAGGRDHPPSPPPPPMPPYVAVSLYDKWIAHSDMLEFDADVDINLAQAGPGTQIGGCAGICGNYGVDDLETSPTNGFLDSQYPTAMPNPFKVKPFWWHGILCTRFSGRAYIPNNSGSEDGVVIHLEQPLGTRISPRVVVRGSGWDANLDAPLDPAYDHFHIMVDMVGNNVGDTVYWDRTTTTVHCHDGRYDESAQPRRPPVLPPSPSPPPPQVAADPRQHALVDLWEAGSFGWDTERIPAMAPYVKEDNTGSFRFERGFGLRIVHADELDAPRYAYARLELPSDAGYYCYRLHGCVLLSNADTGHARAKDGAAFRWMQDGYVLRNWDDNTPFQQVVGPQQVKGQDIHFCYDLRMRGGFRLDYYSDRNPSGSSDPDYWDKNVLDHNMNVECAPSPPPGQGLPPPPPPPPVGTLVNISALFLGGHVRQERAYDAQRVWTLGSNFHLDQLDATVIRFAVRQKHMSSLWLRFNVPDYMGKHCYRLRGTITATQLGQLSDGFRMFARWGDRDTVSDGKRINVVPAWMERDDPPSDYIVEVNPLPGAYSSGLLNPAPFDFRLPGNIDGLTPDTGFVLYMENVAGYDATDDAEIQGAVECEEPGAAWTPASPPAPLPNIPVTHGCCSMSPYRRTCQVTSVAGYEGVGGNPTQGCGGTFCCNNENGHYSGHGLCQDCAWWNDPQYG